MDRNINTADSRAIWNWNRWSRFDYSFERQLMKRWNAEDDVAFANWGSTSRDDDSLVARPQADSVLGMIPFEVVRCILGHLNIQDLFSFANACRKTRRMSICPCCPVLPCQYELKYYRETCQNHERDAVNETNSNTQSPVPFPYPNYDLILSGFTPLKTLPKLHEPSNHNNTELSSRIMPLPATRQTKS